MVRVIEGKNIYKLSEEETKTTSSEREVRVIEGSRYRG